MGDDNASDGMAVTGISVLVVTAYKREKLVCGGYIFSLCISIDLRGSGPLREVMTGHSKYW